FVISPRWSMLGKCRFVIDTGAFSISLAHVGVMPKREAAKGNTPIPSKRLPKVSFVIFHLLFSVFRRKKKTFNLLERLTIFLFYCVPHPRSITTETVMWFFSTLFLVF